MKKTALLGLLTAAAFAATTSMALAEGTQQKAQQHEQRQALPVPTVGQEDIEAKIVSIDKSKGTVSVETTQHGQLEFKLTPAQVQRLSEGDQLRVHILLNSMPKQP